jgi:arsenical pump membrane protein
MSEGATALVWIIAGAAALGVLVRPFRTPEALWAVGGAGLLVALGLLAPAEAWQGVLKSADVCLFLVGMMLLAEVARTEGLFDAVAAFAVGHARGSPRRLFALVYGAGVVITALLSNDATAVVLTPAVFAAARRAGARPLPHLFACAMVANAASFVLPISNPANLVLYASRTPPLLPWLASFALPSLAAVAATFAALRWACRGDLAGACSGAAATAPITRGGWTAIAGLAIAVAVMLTVSALGLPLGAPTAAVGVATLAAVTIARRASPLPMLRGVAWQVIALVAGLFVIVQALQKVGAIAALAATLRNAAVAHPAATPWAAGAGLALASNLVNNLPAGLMASGAALAAHAPKPIVDALLIGVDLGPNLSVTGSLATILWLAAIRREGEHVGAWRFLKVGALVMPPALLLALGARLLIP